MKLFEFCQVAKRKDFTEEQLKFISKIIKRETEKLAEKTGLTPEEAYYRISHGLTEESLQEIPGTEN